jgi:hypothetical protein
VEELLVLSRCDLEGDGGARGWGRTNKKKTRKYMSKNIVCDILVAK